MATGVASWSKTAASNATADSAVNWAEGMAPSAVNDSARSEMASVAKWRDDLNGTITTSGTSTAYTLTSNQGLALTAGYTVSFVPHATNGATVTLNADSLGAKPLRSAPGVELAVGALMIGTPYLATYYTSNSGEWIIQSYFGTAQQTAMQTATATTQYVSPGGAKYHPGVAKAWAIFTISAGTLTTRASYGISQVVRNSAGNYTINFSSAFSDRYYTTIGSARSAGNVSILTDPLTDPTASICIIQAYNQSSVAVDPTEVSVVFHGTLA